jgi:hypothetical protein
MAPLVCALTQLAGENATGTARHRTEMKDGRRTRVRVGRGMKSSTLRQNGSRSLYVAWGVLRIATGRPSVVHANAGRQETGAALKAIHNARPAPSSSPYGGVI